MEVSIEIAVSWEECPSSGAQKHGSKIRGDGPSVVNLEITWKFDRVS